MDRRVISSLLGCLILGQAGARVWTDVKGRTINAEYVSQTADSVVLRLPTNKEVTVPIKNLSREDLTYLIEMETKRPGKPEAGENPGEMPAAGEKPAADPNWSKPVPQEMVFEEPLQIEELKRTDGTAYSSEQFRIVSDGRITEKTARALLEACELTRMYCEALPFGLANRFSPVEGKYEIYTYGEEDAWVEAGGSAGRWSAFDQVTGKFKLCFEGMGLGSSGRGGRDQIRSLVGLMIMHVSRCMIPDLYQQNFKDWFKEGFPNLLNCAVYEQGRLDFTQIASETKDLMLGKKRSGQKAIFEKDVEMLSIDDLVGQTVAGPADEDERRQFLGQCVLFMAYLMFMDDGGKATGLREGLQFLSNFEKTFPKEIRYSSQEELEQKKAELTKRRAEMGNDTMKKIYRDRPGEEVAKDMKAQWGINGLKLVFEGEKD